MVDFTLHLPYLLGQGLSLFAFKQPGSGCELLFRLKAKQGKTEKFMAAGQREMQKNQGFLERWIEKS